MNYIGHELGLGLPVDYRRKFGWFDRFDWQYMIDTRGDMLVVDEGSIEANKEAFDKIVDWGQPNPYISNEFRILTLKKFIPSYYSGEEFAVDDNKQALDNGYFYSPDLQNENVIDFQTNKHSNFSLAYRSTNDARVEFLLYNNRNFKYYMDDQPFVPDIHELQAYFTVPAGEHTVSIRYEYFLDTLQNWFFIIFYSMTIFICVFIAIKRKARCA
jgi:hypothetical protein